MLPSNAWQMDAGEITDNEDISMTPFATIVYLTSFLSVDPSKFFSTLKAIEENSKFVPIIGQEVNIQLAVAEAESSEVFNALVDKMVELVNKAFPENDNASKYIKSRIPLKNFIFVNGGLGTGKTQVVLRHTSEILKQWHKDDIEIVNLAPHDTQLKTLSEVTGSSNSFTFEDALAHIYPNHNSLKIAEQYVHRLNSEDVKAVTKVDALFKSNASIKILVADEITFTSEKDLQLFTA